MIATMIVGAIATVVVIGIVFTSSSFKIVRPMERGCTERFGKYKRIAQPGLNFILPFGIEGIYKVNMSEMMVDAKPQEIITKDKLNAVVDAQVYFKVKDDEQSIKASQYNVYNYQNQIVQLARTTLRNIIGTMTLNDANCMRDKINTELMKTLVLETKTWGISVVRTELKEISPPSDVQATMNKVVIAENEKQAATDFATATEIKADGARRAAIKQAEGERQNSILIAEGKQQARILEAEGFKQSQILEAQGQAKAFDLVNASFTGNAITLRQLEVAENALTNNTKYIVPDGASLVNVISDTTANIVPLERKKK